VDLKQIAEFISQTGFPIFVAIVLLWRVDNMHTANLEALHENTLEIKLLRVALDKHQALPVLT
jgi:hypothetical protein